jgi:hypothetical protein
MTNVNRGPLFSTYKPLCFLPAKEYNLGEWMPMRRIRLLKNLKSNTTQPYRFHMVTPLIFLFIA